jgi:hypothetical protein
VAEELDRDWLQKVALGAAIGAMAGFGVGSTFLKPAQPGVVAVIGTIAGAGLSYALLRPGERPKGYVRTVGDEAQKARDDAAAKTAAAAQWYVDQWGNVHQAIRGDVSDAYSWFSGETEARAAAAKMQSDAKLRGQMMSQIVLDRKAAADAAASPRTNGIPVRGVVFVGR